MNFNRKDMLVDVVHKRLLSLRNLQTVIQLKDFQSLFAVTSEVERKRVMEFIDKFDYTSLREWFKQQRHTQLGVLGVRELRKIASDLGVADYNHLPKSLLLAAITSKRNGSTASIVPFNSGAPLRNEAVNAPSGC